MTPASEQRMLKWIDRDLKQVEKTILAIESKIENGSKLEYCRKGLLRKEDTLFLRRYRILAPTRPANEPFTDCSQVPCLR